ncbi:carboxymuconolactone decarboxylase family protein [Paracoccus siganidrum]|uniref:Carboxymuconolactone decarboxylase family protein n=1 Tax=Paracoccus siganidrum TaxID=1276757 RepID=A0A419A4F8_9RHOB|nr:carboxymuconolactone decarboxylase family protein [Paracoccus siganidrum]RJL09648.1 carboxymuconolactone decarboxylase family protein [Paracoccus siganidrum]RMC35837.1 carboxymuconolactone decarboxylase family protein [Paracoccus siganidrum]
MTSQRLDYFAAAPEVMKPMLALENSLASLSIPLTLRELIKLRVSQINNCAYCLNMHAPAARKAGLSQQKLDVLAAWRESPAFDARERALLGWAEALTRLEQTGAPDADYAALEAAFSPRERAEITLAIGVINIWNRLAVGFRAQHPVDRDADAA